MKTNSFKKLFLTSATSLAFVIGASSLSYATSSLLEDASVEESQERAPGVFAERIKTVKKGEALITVDNVSDFLRNIQKVKGRSGKGVKLEFKGESEGDYNFDGIASGFADLWVKSILEGEGQEQETLSALSTFKMAETDETLSFKDLQIEGYFPKSSKQKSPSATRALFLFDLVLTNAFQQQLKDGIWDQEATATIFEKAIKSRAAKERAKKGSVLPPVPESSEGVARRKSNQHSPVLQKDNEEQETAFQEARQRFAETQKLLEDSQREKEKLSKLAEEKARQIEALEKSKRELTSTLEATTGQLQKETAKALQLEETIAKHKTTLKQRGTDLQISQRQVRDLEADKEKLEKTLTTLEKQLSQAQQASSKLQEEAGAREEERQKAATKQQKKQLKALQQKLEEAEAIKNEASRAKEQLAKSIEEAEQALEKERALVKEKQAKLETASASLQRLEESSSKLASELASVKEELEETSAQNKRFQQYDLERTDELSTLKIDSVKTKRQVTSLQKKFSQLQEEVQQLRAEKKQWLIEKAKLEKGNQKAKKLK